MNNNNKHSPWLIAGALGGLVAVAIGMLDVDGGRSALPPQVAAIVNETTISMETLQRTLQRQQRDSEDLLSDEDQAWVLQRLVDEELLVQRGIELGLAESEISVRSAIVNSVVASVTAEADAANPDDATLRTWFEENSDRFAQASALAVSAWVASNNVTAMDFAAALREDSDVAAPDGVRRLPGLPEGVLPATKLRDYLGPGIASAIGYLPVGAVNVYVLQGRWAIVRVDEKSALAAPQFDQVQAQVLVEYRRHLADQQLRDYLETLRQRADVKVREL